MIAMDIDVKSQLGCSGVQSQNGVNFRYSYSTVNCEQPLISGELSRGL